MILKKIYLTGLLLFAGLALSAQEQYHTFSIKGKYGVTDAKGNEVIKPIHKYADQFPEKQELALYNFDDKIKDIIFNMATGKQESYDYIHPDELNIQDTGYTYIDHKNKKYLRSQLGSRIINVKEEYYDFDNVGKYILAKYNPPPPVVKSEPRSTKNGILPPPKIVPMEKGTGFALMEDNTSMKPKLKGVFEEYLPLYLAQNNDDADEGSVVVREVVLLDVINRNPDFDAIVFSKGITHTVYNGQLALVGKFELKNANREKLVEKASTLMKRKLSEYSEKNMAPPMVSASPNGPSSRPSGGPAQQPKIVYPFFEEQKAENGNKRFVLVESESSTKIIFETQKAFRFSKSDHSIRLIEDEGPDSIFDFDPETGKLYLPEKYWSALGLIIK